jgi:hypothetical protein
LGAPLTLLGVDERENGRPSAREAALARAARAKRWIAGGAVALTGVFSAVAANALPASHSAKPKPTPSAPAQPAVDDGADQQQATPIAPPPEAPQPSSSAGGGAVSGGS